MTTERPNFNYGADGNEVGSAPVLHRDHSTQGREVVPQNNTPGVWRDWGPREPSDYQPPVKDDWQKVDDPALANSLDQRLVHEMAFAPDGLNANLEVLRTAVNEIVTNEIDDAPAFAAHFDMLSSSIQTKVFRTLWCGRHRSILDVLDAVEPKLTLDEMAEAEKWVRSLKVRN